MFGEESREGGEVSSFLRIHMVHELAQVRVGFEDRRRLRSVNESGGKLAGMVHTKLLTGVRDTFT